MKEVVCLCWLGVHWQELESEGVEKGLTVIRLGEAVLERLQCVQRGEW